MMMEWLFNTLTRPLLPLTCTVVCLWVIERHLIHLTASQKSWIWRCVFLKLMLLLLLPTGFLFAVSAHWPFNHPKTETLALYSHAGVNSFELKPPSASADANKLGDSKSGTSRTPTEPSNTSFETPLGRTFWIKTALLIWSVGFGYMVWQSTMQFIRFRRSLLRLQCDFDSELRVMVAKATKAMGLRRQPRLRVSRAIESPILTLGTRTELVLPYGFGDKHGREACRMAIAHEMAHYLRRDLYWNFLTTIGASIYFFWPPIWIAARRYASSMEMACDQIAISRSNLNRTAYAQLLIRLLEPAHAQSPPNTVLSLAWSGSFQTLAERIRSMKLESSVTRSQRAFSAIVCAFVLVAVLVPWAIADDEGKPPKKGSKPKSSPNKVRSSGEMPPDTPSTPPTNRIIRGSASSSAFGFGSSSGNGSGTSFGTTGGTSGGTLSGNSGAQMGGMASGGGSASASVSIGSPENAETGSYPRSTGSRYRGMLGGNQSSGQMSTAGNTLFGGSSGSSSGSSSLSNGRSVSKVREVVDGDSIQITTIKDKKMEVIIRESSDDGIEIRIREARKGKDKVTEVYSEDAEALERDHPEAFEWYQNYAGNPTNGSNANPLVNGLGGKRQTSSSRAQTMNGASGFGSAGGGASNHEATQMMEVQIQELIQNSGDNPEMQQHLQQLLDNIRRNHP